MRPRIDDTGNGLPAKREAGISWVNGHQRLVRSSESWRVIEWALGVPVKPNRKETRRRK